MHSPPVPASESIMGDEPRESSRLKLTDREIERRLRFVDLRSEDLEHIASIRQLVADRAENYATAFFDYLSKIEEAAPLFGNRTVLEQARAGKREHLNGMLSGKYDRAYVEQRIKLATLYGRVGLETRVFLGAFHHMLHVIGLDIIRALGREGLERATECVMSLEKVGFFDLGLMIDVLIDERERVIGLQQAAIRELSTPALQVRDRLLILPIIGVLDSQRAKQLTDNLLHAIRANRAKVVVMDITGVAAVDSKVANHLIQTVAAAKLMGAAVIVTGLSAEVAQSLVALGVDLSKLNTVGDLQGGLEEADRILGYSLQRI
jgi:rsbT co-antagonist protein RsbR